MKVTNNLYIHKTIFFYYLKKQLLNTKHLGVINVKSIPLVYSSNLGSASVTCLVTSR